VLVSSRKEKIAGRVETNQTKRDWPVGYAPAPLPGLPDLHDRQVLQGAMDGEFENQLARLEKMVTEILEAVKNLHDAQMATRADATEINERLRRFLEQKKSG
jgi:hypothetical protein